MSRRLLALNALGSPSDGGGGGGGDPRAYGLAEVGEPAINTNTVVVPTHQEGELLILHVCAEDTTGFAVPDGWTSLQLNLSVKVHVMVAYKFAESASEPCVFTNTAETKTSVAAVTVWPAAGTPLLNSAYNQNPVDASVELNVIALNNENTYAVWLVSMSDDNNLGAQTIGELAYGGTEYEQNVTGFGNSMAMVYQFVASGNSGSGTITKQANSSTADSGRVVGIEIPPAA